MKPKTTRIKFNDLQLNSTSHIEEIQDSEAAKINGGYATAKASDIGTSELKYQQMLADYKMMFDSYVPPEKKYTNIK